MQQYPHLLFLFSVSLLISRAKQGKSIVSQQLIELEVRMYNFKDKLHSVKTG